MARIAAAACSLVVLGLLLPGCRTASRKEASNPFRRGQPTRVAQRTPREAASPVANSDATHSPSSDDERQAERADPTTIALIERELRDVPDPERRELSERLRSLDPVTARMVLRSFRMKRQLDAERAELAEGSPSPSRPTSAGGHAGLGSVARASGELPSLDDFPPPSKPANGSPNPLPAEDDHAVPVDSPRRPVAGLGRENPWGDPAEPPPDERTARRPNGDEPWPTAPPAAEPSPRERLEELARRIAGGTRPGEEASTTGSAVVRTPSTMEDPSVRPAAGEAAPPSVAPPRPSPVGDRGPWGDGDTRTAEARPDSPLEMPESFDTQQPQSESGEEADVDRELQRLVDLIEHDPATTTPGETDEERHAYTERQVYLRMLYLMTGQQERALAPIPELDPRDQEFWQQMLWAIANYVDDESIPDAEDRAGQTVAQLRTAVRTLQSKARLRMRNVSFCTRISSFGNYEPFERDEFRARQPVLVYVEVENFLSEPTADGRYRTLLASRIDLYRAGAGEPIDTVEFPATEDRSRHHRRDYFHSYEFPIPATVGPGPHVMVLTIEDKLSGKVDTTRVNFTVVP